MKRALLLSGGVSQKLDHPWYTRDIAAYYRVLVDTHGYAKDEVRVCMGAGSPLAITEEQLIAVSPARRPDVLEAIRWLAELGADDQAFLMVTDHGSPEGIGLWGKGQFLSPEDLAAGLGASLATKVIVLGQCHSGCFGRSPLGSAVVCCSCDAERFSYPVPRPAPGVEPSFSEFLYQLAGALAGQYPDGTPIHQDGDMLPVPGRVSIGAAFRYARDHDRWITGMQDVNELPRMFDPKGIADALTL